MHRFRWQNFFALSLLSVALPIFGFLFVVDGVRAGSSGLTQVLIGVLMLVASYFVFRLANRLAKDLRNKR